MFVDIVLLINDDAFDIVHKMLLQLSNGKVLDLGETPSVRKLENDNPIFDSGIVERVFRVVEHPEESRKFGRGDVV